MTLLHTTITKRMDISNLVCLAYPKDLTMQVTKGQLKNLFATLLKLHKIVGDLVEAIPENQDGLVQLLGLTLLV